MDVQVSNAVSKEESERQYEQFKEICKPLVKYLCENYHPHVTIIITPTGAEMVEGLMSTKIEEYLVD